MKDDGWIVWIVFSVLILVISFETEIRCQLGNQISCAELLPNPPDPTP